MQYRGEHIWLQGHVVMEHPLGTLHAQQAHIIKKSKSTSVKDLVSIELLDSVFFHLKDESSLSCHSVHINCIEKKVVCRGLPYVQYQQPQATIRSQALFLEYDDQQNSCTKLNLQGDVQLIYTTCEQSMQYALADRVEYDAQQIWLIADVGKKVLFFDPNKQIELSAPKIKMTKPLSGMDINIEGIGDVTMKFQKEELAYLKATFGW